VERVHPGAPRSREPVQIDRTRKVVTIVEDHPSFQDQIQVGKTTFRLNFKEENSSNGEPCVVESNSSITIYTKFPLFRSRRYGELFKRICILIAVARRRCKTAQDMYTFVLEEMKDMFEDYE
jgi:hypothetical protein